MSFGAASECRKSSNASCELKRCNLSIARDRSATLLLSNKSMVGPSTNGAPNKMASSWHCDPSEMTNGYLRKVITSHLIIVFL